LTQSGKKGHLLFRNSVIKNGFFKLLLKTVTYSAAAGGKFPLDWNFAAASFQSDSYQPTPQRQLVEPNFWRQNEILLRIQETIAM
jgi:hypothetical protein